MAEREKYPSEAAERFQLRLPDGMRDRLKEAAAASGRSMNTEIVHRLEQSFSTWPAVKLPQDVTQRVLRGSAEKRQKAEREIQELALTISKHHFPVPEYAINSFVVAFKTLLDQARFLENDEREAIEEDFLRLVEKVHVETMESE